MGVNLLKEEATKKLDLRKKTLKVSLEKKSLNDITARVAVVMDKSGSMRSYYTKNLVQEVLERIFPLALKFDDNGELDIWLFHNDFKRMNSVTNENFYEYVDKEILKGPWGGSWGGTSYAPVMKDIIRHYIKEETSQIPTYVIFVTDGENDDRNETTKVISEASKYNIFWQFVGIGNEKFQFLNRLDTLSGRLIDNANFFEAKDIDKISDSSLYDMLLNEYPSWLKESKERKLFENMKYTEEEKKSGSFFSKLFGL